MKGTGSACCLLLLTMAAVSSGRNAKEYFEEARFQYSPARPEDALVFFVANAPPLICEPEKDGECDRVQPKEAEFCLSLPHGSSFYTCSFEGNATTDTNLKLIKDILQDVYVINGSWKKFFTKAKMYCTTDSQLPDEYFHMRVRRPHEDREVKCRLLVDSDEWYVRFPGYPTIVCQIGAKAGSFRFNLPGIDDALKCAFRVYSELPLGDTRTEKRLYQALISGLPARVDGARPRVVCSRHVSSNGWAHFQLLLKGGDTYDCSFPDAVTRCMPPPEKGMSKTTKVIKSIELPPE